jgi:hypothetical protein
MDGRYETGEMYADVPSRKKVSASVPELRFIFTSDQCPPKDFWWISYEACL